MHLNTDLHQQLALDRQRRLWADAAAPRLADSTPARSRIAQSLRRAADRLDAATAAPCRVCVALPELD